MALLFQVHDSAGAGCFCRRAIAACAVTLTALGSTTAGSAGFTDAEHVVVSSDPPYSHDPPRLELGTCYFQSAQQLAAPAAAGQDLWAGSSSPLRLEGGCNVPRTPIGAVALRGSVATLQPLSQADAQGIITTLGVHRLAGFSLGSVPARAEAAVRYTHLYLGPTAFGELYSVEGGLLTNARKGLELGVRYRGNYGESQLAAPAVNLPGSWLHQIYAVTSWQAPVTHGALTVGASAGYLMDRVESSNQNGGWQVALSAQYPISPRVMLVAGSGYNEREYRPYLTREVLLVDRPENTWSCNVGVSYAASQRTSLRLEWVGSAPASELKGLSYESSSLAVTISTSY
jgi:hypothetical protein